MNSGFLILPAKLGSIIGLSDMNLETSLVVCRVHERLVFQPPFFRGYSLVFGGVSMNKFPRENLLNHQPIWNICSSKWIISPGVKIKNVWNHHLVYRFHGFQVPYLHLHWAQPHVLAPKSRRSRSPPRCRCTRENCRWKQSSRGILRTPKTVQLEYQK